MAQTRRALAWPARAFLLAMVLGLAACSVNPKLAMPVGDAVLLAGVPFHPQTEYQCGPAALAGLLGASGIAVTPAQLKPQVYLPKRQGSLQLELMGAARRAGRIAYVIDRDPGAVLAELQAGRPVLVLQNVLTPSVPRWHYALVVGSDPARHRLLLNTGVDEARPTRARSFLRTWDWADRWGIVALRPGELPARVDPLRYAEAVAAFEPVGGAVAARLAWEAGRQRWPDDHRAHLALGNLDYAAGDRDAALASFARGLAVAPREPVLSNNYASVLAETGCRGHARQVLHEALEVLPPGSPWLAALTGSRDQLPATSTDPARCSQR